jgi:hypothetical protein
MRFFSPAPARSIYDMATCGVYRQCSTVSERAMLLSFPSPLSPDPIRLSLRSGSSTLALGMNHVVWFDGAGRLLTA